LAEQEFFARLTATCDAALTDLSAHGAWLASPFLSVMSAHPIHWARYAVIRSGQGLGGPEGGRSRDAARSIRNILRAAVARSPQWPQADVLLVGGLVAAGHLEHPKDFYFGGIQGLLDERGATSLLLLRNQTGQSTRALGSRARRTGRRARLLLSDSPALDDELTSQREAAAGAAAMRHRAATAPAGSFEREVLAAAAWDVGSASTAGNLRLQRMVEEAVRETGARIVIAMYEGHAWERCVWRGARRANPRALCVGYQHTILRKSSHAIRRNVGGGSNPDVVLCAGRVTSNELAADSRLAGTRFVAFGTHRRESDARDASAPNPAGACLVVPEGIEGEAALLFETAARAAALAPETTFVFRSHPILPFEKLVSGRPTLGRLPANVEISAQGPLDTDLARCGAVLYRGSSTALHGVLAGLKPFYLMSDEVETIDPMYALPAWREKVSDAESLVAGLRADAAADRAARVAKWSVARDFCRDYFIPEQAEVLVPLLDAVRGHA
jgi:hypothetical protein